MKTVFFGSPAIASDLLSLLNEGHYLDIALIVTQPDKPVGKNLKLTPTPVKQLAQKLNISIFDGDMRNKEIQMDLISRLLKEKFKLGILYAYGSLIPASIINLFPQGIWNMHPSLLPLYRGPSPTAYPLLLGDTKTGVTIMKLVQKLDAGPIINQREVLIDPLSTRESLEKKLTILGASLIKESIYKITENSFAPTYDQDASNSTYTRLLKKEDGYISPLLIRKTLSGESTIYNEIPPIIREYEEKYKLNFSFTAAQIVWNMYRAFQPWPGIWTTILTPQGQKRLLIKKVSLQQNNLYIQEVQLEGKRSVDFAVFNKAYNFTGL